jgi:hypothetical protein
VSFSFKGDFKKLSQLQGRMQHLASGKVVARPMVPERSLPSSWSRAFNDVTRRFMSRIFKK